MARPKKDAVGEQPAGTKPVRVEADLAFMLDVISTAFQQDISKILSPQIRSFVERKYDEALQRLAERRRRPAD